MEVAMQNMRKNCNSVKSVEAYSGVLRTDQHVSLLTSICISLTLVPRNLLSKVP